MERFKMDWYLVLINAIITLLIGGWLFKYFDDLFNAQADLIDRILKNSNIRFHTDEEDDSQKTHILGGVVDHGTHTTGVCSDECWCHSEEE
jgi:hypothetical protein